MHHCGLGFLRPRAGYWHSSPSARIIVSCIMGGEIEPPSDHSRIPFADCRTATFTTRMVFVNDEDKRYAKGRILTVSFYRPVRRTCLSHLSAHPSVAKLTYSLRAIGCRCRVRQPMRRSTANVAPGARPKCAHQPTRRSGSYEARAIAGLGKASRPAFGATTARARSRR
jgi:hypothetical protein